MCSKESFCVEMRKDAGSPCGLEAIFIILKIVHFAIKRTSRTFFYTRVKLCA